MLQKRNIEITLQIQAGDSIKIFATFL